MKISPFQRHSNCCQPKKTAGNLGKALRFNLMAFALAVFWLAILPSSGETVAWWRFEEDGNSEMNPEDFSVELSPTTEFSDDVPAPKLRSDETEFRNVSSYSNGKNDEGTWMGYSDLLNDVIGMESFTIEGFIKLNDRAGTAKYMRIIGTMHPKIQPMGWAVSVHAGKLVFAALQGAESHTYNPGRLESTKTLSEETWHHFAIVGIRDPKKLNVEFYIDGEKIEGDRIGLYPESIGQNAIVATENPIRIGAPNPFQGKIDELRISDVPLDPADFLKAVLQ